MIFLKAATGRFFIFLKFFSFHAATKDNRLSILKMNFAL